MVGATREYSPDPGALDDIAVVLFEQLHGKIDAVNILRPAI
jgi:hypothetical protein